MNSLKNFVFTNVNLSWNSYYSASDQPSSLFTGVRHRLLITLNKYKSRTDGKKYSTNFIKWFNEERPYLFNVFIKYYDLQSSLLPPNSKISSSIEDSILKKLSKRKTLNNYVKEYGVPIYYHNAPVHWHKVFDFIPYFAINGLEQKSSHVKGLYLSNVEESAIVICLLNSSLFYWYNWQYSNCRDLSLKDIYRMPFEIDLLTAKQKSVFVKLKQNLLDSYRNFSKVYKRKLKKTRTEFDAFYPMYSKPIIDEIDKVLAVHYGFTEEELDFIINYDIKYRMGKESAEADNLEEE